MSIFRINFKQLRQEGLKDVFDALERAFNLLQVDFYLIGALARDTWLAQKGVRALGTRDIDFAVLVPDQNTYIKLRDYLTGHESFTASGNEFVLFHKGLQIDLLPFTEVADQTFIPGTMDHFSYLSQVFLYK